MKLLFVGDFFYNYEYLADDLLELSNWIQKENYQVIVNLEGGLYPSPKPIVKRGHHLHQSHRAIDMMKKLNVVGACLANNHMMDFGPQALKKTLKTLDENGIAHTGAGMNVEEALQPMVLGTGKEQTVIVNFAWDVEESVYATKKHAGCAPRQQELILNSIKSLRTKYPEAKFIAVMHWGFELNPLPQPLDVKLAHEMIHAGFDLIIGHHPHNIQPFELYQEKAIYYSLGNFYFSGYRSNFNKRRFKGAFENLCDYGAMVVFDSESGESVHNQLLVYDIDQNVSRRVFNDGRVLRDITGADFFSATYEEEARSSSLNKTPILTLDKKNNQRKLRKLFLSYRISRLTREVRRMPVGEWIYQRVKRIHHRDR